jgi:hypothetical protein
MSSHATCPLEYNIELYFNAFVSFIVRVFANGRSKEVLCPQWQQCPSPRAHVGSCRTQHKCAVGTAPVISTATSAAMRGAPQTLNLTGTTGQHDLRLPGLRYSVGRTVVSTCFSKTIRPISHRLCNKPPIDTLISLSRHRYGFSYRRNLFFLRT